MLLVDCGSQKMKINIISSHDYIQIMKVESELPFLYSGRQTKDITKQSDTLHLFFNIFEYNNEVLFLSNKKNNSYFLVLNQCKKYGNTLQCDIPKTNFEEILYDNTQIFSLSYYNYYINKQKFNSVFDITINYNINEKENISLAIIELNENNIDLNNYIAYETNITDIPAIQSKTFFINFNSSISFPCLFKKTSNNPLYMLCNFKEEGIFSLDKVEQEITLIDINVKYNIIS